MFGMRLFTTLVVLFAVQFLSAQDLNDGLLLHYPMSGNANDISGNGFHGVVNATLTEDRFGNPNEAYHFNGMNEFIDFPNMDELKPPLPLTISFWIKYDDFPSTDRAVFNTSLEEDVNSGVFLTSESATGKYAIGYGDGDPAYNTGSIRKYVSNSIIEMEDWHHLTLVYTSATDMKIYVDCIEAGGTYGGLGGALEYSPAPGSIGRHDQTVGVPSYYFQGAIDDFRYWDRALTIEEIDIVCNSEPFDCPELEVNFGDECDDGNVFTVEDVINSDCECLGVPAVASLGGAVEGFSECGSKEISVSFYEPGTVNLVAEYTTVLAENGSYEIPTVPVGIYDVFIKLEGALQIGFFNYEIVNDSNVIDLEDVVLGDLNGDNAVNIVDVSVLCASFGSLEGEPNFDGLSDFNCDGWVNIVDVSFLNLSFGQTGDSP